MYRDIWREDVRLWFLCVSATCVGWIGVVSRQCVSS
jgi:hypothetical protein